MRKTLLLLAIILGLVITVTAVLRDRVHPLSGRTEKLVAAFMECLPPDLTKPQREEVRDTLERFRKRVARGKVAPKDRQTVIALLERYVEKGSIERKELQVFMAKVSYYSLRFTPDYRPFERGIPPPDHPLLEEDDQSSNRQAPRLR